MTILAIFHSRPFAFIRGSIVIYFGKFSSCREDFLYFFAFGFCQESSLRPPPFLRDLCGKGFDVGFLRVSVSP